MKIPAGVVLMQRYGFPQGLTLRTGDVLQLVMDDDHRGIVGHRIVPARAPMPRGPRVGRAAALVHRVGGRR